MPSPHKKIALLHHVGGGNLGDDATLDINAREIMSRWPNATITLFCMNPEYAAKKYGLPACAIRKHTWTSGYNSAPDETKSENGPTLWRWLKTSNYPAVRFPRSLFRELAFLKSSLRTVKSFDILIISGGGQLTERSGPWSFPYTIFLWVLLARVGRIKSIFLNVGAGPLNHALSKFFVTRALFSAEYVSFRDKESQTLAQLVGFDGESHVFPDSVYNLEPPSSMNASRDRRHLVVGISPIAYPYCDPREYQSGHEHIYKEFIARLGAFADALLKSSYSVELFGNDTSTDPRVIEDLRTTLASRHNILIAGHVPVNSVSDLLFRISNMDYVVTCRFHGVVFAHLLNKPVLAIAHHPKVTHLMNTLGLAKYCVDIRGFDPIRFADTFGVLVSEAEVVRECMAKSLQHYKAQLKMQFDQLFPPYSNEPNATKALAGIPAYEHRAPFR